MLRLPSYDSYRYSGIEWLGNIPQHWQTKKLKYCAVLNPSVLPESTERSESIEYVDIGSVSQGAINNVETFTFGNAPSRARRLVAVGDTIVSTVRTYLKAIAYIDHEHAHRVFSTGFSVLRPQQDFHSKYFSYFCQSETFVNKIVSESKGVSFPAVTSVEIGNLATLIPTLTEQTRIAAFLDEKTAEIDAAIAKQQRLIELLQEQKALLINRAVTRGIDPNAPLQDSGVAWIGEMPAHWQVSRSKWLFAHRKERSRLGDQQLTASQEFGVIPQQEYMEKTGYRVMQVTLNTEILKHVEVDDFVISMRSFQGGLERAKASGCISSAYVVLESSPQANIDYFTYLFKSVRYIEALQSTSNLVRDGQALRYDNFCMVPLPVIPIKEQEAIAAFLDQATSQIDTLREKIQKEIELLKEFRTILISQAVTGKIKV
jgi:type I restriction enzyme S subunit